MVVIKVFVRQNHSSHPYPQPSSDRHPVFMKWRATAVPYGLHSHNNFQFKSRRRNPICGLYSTENR